MRVFVIFIYDVALLCMCAQSARGECGPVWKMLGCCQDLGWASWEERWSMAEFTPPLQPSRHLPLTLSSTAFLSSYWWFSFPTQFLWASFQFMEFALPSLLCRGPISVIGSDWQWRNAGLKVQGVHYFQENSSHRVSYQVTEAEIWLLVKEISWGLVTIPASPSVGSPAMFALPDPPSGLRWLVRGWTCDPNWPAISSLLRI